MKLKHILYSSILGVATATSLTGCNDAFLERAPQSLNDNTYWNTPNDLMAYANNFYGILPGGVNNVSDTQSDDQVPSSVNQFIWDQFTVPTEGGDWSKSNWQNIRNINYFMTHYGTVTGDENEINIYVAEMRFFRALEYYSKIRTYGDVPWLDRDLNTDSEELYGPRDPRNVVARHIVEDLDFAIQWLPEKGAEDPNRLNKDIARHVKARICLNEGTHYKYHTELGYDASESTYFLQLAASESDALINSGHYEIYSTGDPARDFYHMFVMEDKSNLSEAILYIDYAEDLRMHNMSHGAMESSCGFSKDFVDCILYADGLPKALTSYPTDDTTMEQELANRDPRATQTIQVESFFTNLDYPSLDYYKHITADDNYVTQYCPTGYQTIKGYNPSLPSGYFVETSDGIAYRYDETLLINAEAKAELGTITQADLDRTINVLRDRVGMPHLDVNVGFTDPNWPDYGYTLTPVLQEIRRERRVELAGEGFRWDDLVRWKAGNLLNNVMTYVGKKISTSSSMATEGFRSNDGYVMVYPQYTNLDLSYQENKSRTWQDKMYLKPIPTGELQRNPQLQPQNPGW